MTNPFDPCAGLCRVLICLAGLVLAVGLAACGPGTGGTGTGPIASPMGYSGSATVSVLTGATAGGSSVTTPPVNGCTADCAQANLRLDADRVELTTPCLRFVFTGSWTVDAGGLALVAGALQPTQGSDAAVSNAALRLQFSSASADSPQVTLTLSDDTGRTLLGPATLLRNDAAVGAAPPACVPQ